MTTPYNDKILATWINQGFINGFEFSSDYQTWINVNYPGETINSIPISSFKTYLNDRNNLYNSQGLPFIFENGTYNLYIAHPDDLVDTQQLSVSLQNALYYGLQPIDLCGNFTYPSNYGYNTTEVVNDYAALLEDDVLYETLDSSYTQEAKAKTWWMIHHGGSHLSPIQQVVGQDGSKSIKSAYGFITDISMNDFGTTSPYTYFRKAYNADWLRDGYKQLRESAQLINTWAWSFMRQSYSNKYYGDITTEIALDGNMSFEFWFDKAYGPNSPTYNTPYQLIVGGNKTKSDIDTAFIHNLTFNNNKFIYSTGETAGNNYINYNYIANYATDISNSIISASTLYEKYYIDNSNNLTTPSVTVVGSLSTHLNGLKTLGFVESDTTYDEWWLANYSSESTIRLELYPFLGFTSTNSDISLDTTYNILKTNTSTNSVDYNLFSASNISYPEWHYQNRTFTDPSGSSYDVSLNIICANEAEALLRKKRVFGLTDYVEGNTWLVARDISSNVMNGITDTTKTMHTIQYMVTGLYENNVPYYKKRAYTGADPYIINGTSYPAVNLIEVRQGESSFIEYYSHDYSNTINKYKSLVYPNTSFTNNIIPLTDFIPESNTISSSDYTSYKTKLLGDPNQYFLPRFIEPSWNNDNIDKSGGKLVGELPLTFNSYINIDTLINLNYSTRKRPWSTFYDWLVMHLTGYGSAHQIYYKLINIGYLPSDNYYNYDTSLFINDLSGQSVWKKTQDNNSLKNTYNNLISGTTTTTNNWGSTETVNIDASNNIIGSYYQWIYNENTKSDGPYYAYFKIPGIIDISNNPADVYTFGISAEIINVSNFPNSTSWVNSLGTYAVDNITIQSLYNDLKTNGSIPSDITFYQWNLYKNQFSTWLSTQIENSDQITFYNGMLEYGIIPTGTTYWEWLIQKEQNITGDYQFSNAYYLGLYNYNIQKNLISRDEYYFENWYEDLFGGNSLTPVSDRWKGIPVTVSDVITTPIYEGGGKYPYPKSVGSTFYYTNTEKQFMATIVPTLNEIRIIEHGYDFSGNDAYYFPDNSDLNEPGIEYNIQNYTYGPFSFIHDISYASDIPDYTYKSYLPYIDSNYLTRIEHTYSNFSYNSGDLIYIDPNLIIEVPRIPTACEVCTPLYKKMVTSGNNPTQSGRMAYANYIRRSKPRINAKTMTVTIPPKFWKINFELDISGNANIAEEVYEIPNNKFKNNIILADVYFEVSTSLIRIGANAFRSSGITSITIPPSVIDISANAFRNTFYLNSLDIPINLKIIPHGFLYNSRIKYITGGESIEYIDNFAFAHTSKLEKFNVGSNSLLEIGKYAFFNSDISFVQLPNTVRTVQDGSFYSCNKLETFIVPRDLLNINKDTLKNCLNLKTVSFHSSSVLYQIKDSAFYNDISLNNITFPNSLHTINKKAFAYCSFIDLIFPNNVKVLGNSAFENQGYRLDRISHGNTLTKLNLGQIESIGERCFYNNQELETLTISSSLKYLKKESFRNCLKLPNIILPNSIIFIGEGAFRDCTSIQNITIGNQIDYIADYLFTNCYNMRYITMNFPILTFGKYSFSNNITLVSLTTVNATEIKTGCFSGCSSINNVSLNYKLSYLADNLFYKCRILRNMTFATPSGIAFDIYDKDDPDERGSYISIGDYTFYSVALTRFTISPNTQTIGDYTFSNSSYIIYINLYSTVLTSIGDYAFRNCATLQCLNFPENLTSVGPNALFGCQGITKIGMTFQQAVLFNLISNDFLPTNIVYDGNTIFTADHIINSERKILDITPKQYNAGPNRDIENLIDYNLYWGAPNSVIGPYGWQSTTSTDNFIQPSQLNYSSSLSTNFTLPDSLFGLEHGVDPSHNIYSRVNNNLVISASYNQQTSWVSHKGIGTNLEDPVYEWHFTSVRNENMEKPAFFGS
jgi:hypothetical protein